ncbi:10067_t:CDS:2, partial [Acaulospora morrowiae]
KSCIVSRNCIDSKNHPVLKNRPDSQSQRAASNNYKSTPTKNCIESKSKNLAVCANADKDPLSKSLDSHSLRVLKLAKNEFSVIAMRRFKKDEFILQYSGDVHSARNFLQLKYEYSNLDIYFNLFVERNHDNTMNDNMYAPFINRSDTPNCYIQITKEGGKKDDDSNNCDSKHSVYKVGIFALFDIVPGVELKLGLNLIENGNLMPATQKNRSRPTANSASYHSQPPRPLLPSDHPSQSSSQLDQANDSFPMSIQITSEERRHHNKFQNLVTAIQLLETSIVNYCIEHAQDPIISPAEKLSETAVMLFGLPQSMFSRIHAVISICLRENIGIDQCQTCLLNAFRLFLEWTTSDGDSETNKSSSTPIQWSTSSRFHRRYHGSRNSNIKISLFEKFVTCFLLSLKGTFDVIPISTLVWSERLSISKYRLVRWELECLKAIKFEVMITSTLYFCWLGKLCDELEV